MSELPKAIEALLPSNDVKVDNSIYVPDGIIDLWGKIHSGKYAISHDGNGWCASVPLHLKFFERQWKLISVKRDDLNIGDVAFRSNVANHDITNVSSYCIVTGKDDVQFLNGESCIKEKGKHYNFWLKVVKTSTKLDYMTIPTMGGYNHIPD